jgi:hypothetical protein
VRIDMGKKSPNLGLALPLCRGCGRHWRPAQGVVASCGYCKRCAGERRAKAAAHFGLKPIAPEEVTGAYRLPRALRNA